MEFGIDIKNIKRHEAAIITMAAIVILFIIIFWLSVYSPAKKRMNDLKNQFNTLESEMKKIEAMAEGGKSLDTAYTEFYRRLTALDAKIPREERTTLGDLSAQADKMNIEVSSIRPERVKESGLPVKIEARDVKAMPISMHIICDYITLGEYLNALRDTLPALISVDLLTINGPPSKGGRLDITLNLTLYLLTE